MQYSLAYGRERLTVELPEKNVVKVLKIQSSAALDDPIDAVFDVLEEPIESEPLATIAEGRKSACVVVCDATRAVPSPTILAPILQTLEDSGIDVSRITILVGTSLRRNCTQEERTEIIGEDILLRKFKVCDHSSRKSHQHEYLGVTKNGTPIWIDRRYLEAEVKILTGVIQPHSVVGFSGGRESICPGITTTETVSACFSPEHLEHENVRLGNINDNPVHAEQMEIARKIGCDFVVNVLVNQDRQISKVFGGHLNHAFLKGVSAAQKVQTDTVEKQVDIVVTSGGGFPLDKTWQGTVRGIGGAIDIVKPGGTIIIASCCQEGIGSEEMKEKEGTELFASIENFIEAVGEDENFSVDQWHWVELAKVLRKCNVKVVAPDIPAETLEKHFVTPCENVESAVADAIKEYGEQATIAVIPEGPTVLALAKHKEAVINKTETKKAEIRKTKEEGKLEEKKPKAVKTTEVNETEAVEPKTEESAALDESKPAEVEIPTKKAAKKTAVKKAAAKEPAVKKSTTKKAAAKKVSAKSESEDVASEDIKKKKVPAKKAVKKPS